MSDKLPAGANGPGDKDAEARPAGMSKDEVTIRRAPKLAIFLIVGGGLGAVATFILTALYPVDPRVGFGALFGYFALYGVPFGVLVGAVVALILDRRSRRKTTRATVEHETVHQSEAPESAQEQEQASEQGSELMRGQEPPREIDPGDPTAPPAGR